MTWWHDIRFAIRNHTRRPAASAVAIGILALGLGLNVTALSVLNTLLLHPYAYPHLDRLVLVQDVRPREGAHQGKPIAPADYEDLMRDRRVFAAMGAFKAQPIVLSGGDEPQAVDATGVSATFFDLLGVRAERGRTFAADEDRPGRDDVVVFSHRLWVSRFASNPAVVGSDIVVNGRHSTIVGIISDADCYPPGVDAWVPLLLTAADRRERTVQNVAAVARLNVGVTIQEARQDLDVVAERLAHLYPDTNRGRGFRLMALRTEQYEFTAPLFLMVQAAALFVLALGIANVTNLQLARAFERQREFAVRRALGASGHRIFTHVLLDALVLAAAGGACGIVFAPWAVTIVRASLPEGIARWVAGWYAIRLDRVVVVAAVWLTAAAGLAIGVAIGAQMLRSSTHASLRDGGWSATGRTHGVRRALIAGEVCLAVVLLIAAGVMLRSYRDLGAAFTDLHPDRVLTFDVNVPEWSYPDNQHVVEFHNRLLSTISTLPGVERAALIRNTPASNVPSPSTLFTINGRAPLSVSDTSRADVQSITPAAFETLSVPMLSGRAFRDGDRDPALRVAIVSRAMARRFWFGADPVGAVIRLGHPAAPPLTVVGVAGDFKLNWYDPESRAVIYLPSAQAPSRRMHALVKANGDPLQLARPIANAVRGIDARQAISGLKPLQEEVDDSLAPVRVLSLLLLVCGAVAVALAAAGIYGVLAHWVASRGRELGVRLALGAQAGDLMRLVLFEAFRMGLIGLTIGVPLALGAARLGQQSLFGLASPTISVIGGVCLLTLAIVTAAAAGPALRTLRADPRRLLQSE